MARVAEKLLASYHRLIAKPSLALDVLENGRFLSDPINGSKLYPVL